jgi:hypothetical protein
MPNAPPNAAIQRGKPAGRVSPSRSPVMAAEPSRMALRGPRRRSVTIAPATAAAITASARGPKNHTAAATTGIRVATTVHMMRTVLSGPLR